MTDTTHHPDHIAAVRDAVDTVLGRHTGVMLSDTEADAILTELDRAAYSLARDDDDTAETAGEYPTTAPPPATPATVTVDVAALVVTAIHNPGHDIPEMVRHITTATTNG